MYGSEECYEHSSWWDKEIENYNTFDSLVSKF